MQMMLLVNAWTVNQADLLVLLTHLLVFLVLEEHMLLVLRLDVIAVLREKLAPMRHQTVVHVPLVKSQIVYIKTACPALRENSEMLTISVLLVIMDATVWKVGTNVSNVTQVTSLLVLLVVHNVYRVSGQRRSLRSVSRVVMVNLVIPIEQVVVLVQ